MERVLSVSQLNEYVRRTLAADPMLRGIRLRGEVSNFKRHSAGHLYFSLKDEEARIACVMFRSAAASLRVQPRDGMRVVAAGSAALYTSAGQYQFYVDAMREDGVGALHIAFEALKASLAAEGLFDAGIKKPLPLLPGGVGIVTSPTGAVMHDIQQVAARRNPGVRLYLRPTQVQGEGAAEDIARAIRALDENDAVDVIILARGGGSLEDLWPFNEEAVARAIFAANTPVVSAVGHETDYTIADFAADVRASTPSAAAELVVPRIDDLREQLNGCIRRMRRAQTQRLALARQRLQRLLAHLNGQRPQKRIAQQRARIDACAGLLAARMQAQLAARRGGLNALYGRLNALSPGRVLARGYSLASLADGSLLTDGAKARQGDAIHVRLRAGALDATVTEVYDGKNRQA